MSEDRSSSTDEALGLHRKITRRDFLNGVSVGIGSATLASQTGLLAAFDAAALGAQSDVATAKSALQAANYPSALTGLRGSYDETYKYAHMLRDGACWEAAPKSSEITESYDLVVVGGAISGLAAAYFYRQKAGNSARILILDNHDDFGGHAKRNEFMVNGRMVLSYGGTQSIESPGKYSAVAKKVLTELGIDSSVFYKQHDQKLYAKLGSAVFFDKETFGQDRIVQGLNQTPWPEFLAQAPLSEAAHRDIAGVYTAKGDYLPGMTRGEARQAGRRQLCRLSYETLQRNSRGPAVFSDLLARPLWSRH